MSLTRVATVVLTLSCTTHAMARMSLSDSNLSPRDTHSRIAPALPMPAVGLNASVGDYLRAARDALASGRTGLAQQSLEMAETRLLNRSVPVEEASRPIQDPRVASISDALHSLGAGSPQRSMRTVSAALSGNYDIARMR